MWKHTHTQKLLVRSVVLTEKQAGATNITLTANEKKTKNKTLHHILRTTQWRQGAKSVCVCVWGEGQRHSFHGMPDMSKHRRLIQ